MEQENKTYTGEICGNCDVFCECGLSTTIPPALDLTIVC